MEKRGLLFIPDITGFTRFVNEMEIEHSRLIIQELLEILINANQVGLEISEIEGDAILFYKYGEPPELKDLYQQVEAMFCAFHRNLIAYDNRRFCQCRGCTSAVDLTLKVITHYGEFTDYHVKDFRKLIGKDIIVAHQLLKNDIEQHEYWLVTNPLVKNSPSLDFQPWMEWDTSIKQTDGGDVPYHYTQLGKLKEELSAEPWPELKLSDKARMISASREFDSGIIELFHLSGDFNYRHRWQEGVQSVEELNHFLPRVGTRCRCIFDDGHTVDYTTNSYAYHPDKIEFSETDEKKRSITHFILEKISGEKTRLTVNFYISRNSLLQTIFKLNRKKKMETGFKQSLLNLEHLVLEIRQKGEIV